jgi:hypothetical protein
MVGTPPGRPLLFREVRFRSLEQAAEDANAIDQEAAVGGIVAAALGHGAVHAQTIAAGQPVLLRQDQHAIIHLMQGLWTYASFQIVLSTVIGHGMIVEPHPALVHWTVSDGLFRLPIRPPFSAAQEGQAIAGFQREGMPPPPGALVMRS